MLAERAPDFFGWMRHRVYDFFDGLYQRSHECYGCSCFDSMWINDWQCVY